MMKRGSFWTIGGLLLALGLSTQLCAQNTETLLKEGYDLYQRGRDEEALQKMKALIAADPSSEDAFRLIQTLEPRVWASLMLKGDEHQAVVRTLMNAAIPGAKAHQRDGGRIRELVKQLDTGSWPERQRALTSLVGDHGEHAAAYLIGRLNSDDTEKRAVNMEWLRNMGTESIHPLIQVLESSDPLTQAGAATVLGQLKAVQAKPYLARLAAGSAEPMPKEAASKALAALGGSHSGVASGLVALAEGYYQQDKSVVDPYRVNTTVWSYEGDALVGRDVPGDIYALKLAEEALYDALEVEPGHTGAEELLASVLLAQVAAGAGSSEGGENPLARAGDLARALGPKVLDAALRKALDDNRPEIATAAIDVIAEIPGASSLGGVGLALGSSAKGVRVHAALAAAGDASMSNQIVPILSEGVALDSVRSVLVIDDQPASRNQVVADLSARGYFSYGVLTGPEGLVQLRSYPLEDAVVIRYNLATSTAADVIRYIRRDPKTEALPVALLVDAKDMDAAKELFSDRVQLFIQTPPVAEAYEPQLRALVNTVDAAREASIQLAARCAQALAHMDPATARSAQPALAAALGGVDDRVRIPALAALARVADGSATDAILALLKDSTQSDGLRGHAAIALASIAKNGGTASADVVEAILGALTGEGSGELFNHLSKATGLLPIDGATRLGLLKQLRSRITVGSTGEGE
ncbi:MAG TPA: HEAT repeat domain-containing protein [Planctomycetota bacterium]|nr:HEAT repeat domain-containing protein [Planctomycetota bacterium]